MGRWGSGWLLFVICYLGDGGAAFGADVFGGAEVVGAGGAEVEAAAAAANQVRPQAGDRKYRRYSREEPHWHGHYLKGNRIDCWASILMFTVIPEVAVQTAESQTACEAFRAEI